MVGMSTTSERGAEVRRRLIDAASELIAERGWSAVSTRMVAERAGVTPGVVHYHFSSVRGLLTTAALHTVRSVANQVCAVLTWEDDLTAGLAPLVRGLDAYPGDDPTSRLFAEAYLAAHRDVELRTQLTAVLREVRTAIGRWLAANRVPEPEDTAAVLVSAIDGMMLHRALVPDLEADTVTPILTRLLRADGSASRPEPEETAVPSAPGSTDLTNARSSPKEEGRTP